ncbi:MAG: hypothetical protein AAF799_37455 [Myxococcota bacterium]
MAGSRWLAVGLALAACSQQPDAVEQSAPVESPSAADPQDEAIARLAHWEDEQRRATNFEAERPWSERSGPNPFRLLPRASGEPWVLRRGAGQIARFGSAPSDDGVPTATDATDWALSSGDLWVVSPRSGELWRHALAEDPEALPSAAVRVGIEGSDSLRSIASGPGGSLAVGDAHAHRVMVVDPAASMSPAGAKTVAPRWSAACGGPIELRFAPGRLLALCMLDHRLSVWALGDDGLPHGEPVHVPFDGPLWSLDVEVLPAQPGDARPPLRVVLGGVEDHPLDRGDGAFGYVDSFAFVVDLPVVGAPERRAQINLASHGAVTPKWVDLRVDEGVTTLHAIGYGADTLVTARWGASFGEPSVSTRAVVPGISDAVLDSDGARGVAVSPLLDARVRWDDSGVEVIVEPGAPDTEVRLGEALAFTGLMGPAAISEGKRSRFTCETCHFEGLVDGRVHFTGRGTVHATTRSLRGLFNNRPHFSRALDPTMATMAHNEFDVASRGTAGDPWFSVSPEQTPWVAYLGVTESVGPERLRRALMRFLMEFTPEPNPRAAVAGRVEEPAVARGAELFARHCEQCHSARWVTDDAGTRVEPERWLSSIADGGAIVWASDRRVKTGIEPYVHEDGARVPPLRRLYVKRPYFTNGSAGSLSEVLEGFVPGAGLHFADGGARLEVAEQAAVLAFIELL